MTRSKWVKLSPEEQRIKVALLAGWTGGENGDWIEPDGTSCQCLYPSGGANGKLVGFGKYDNEAVPSDYLNDLNACHDMEEALPEERKRTFAFILAQILDTTPTVDLDDQFLNIHATAAHRAEAFVLTMEPE